MGAHERPASPTAIVIDDMPEMAQFLCDLCRACGLDSRRFADSREVDPARLRDAAVVFLDLTLPGLDGVELMRVLGGQRLKTPIVLVSGHDHCTLEAAAAAGRECGLRIHGVLHKPFSIPQFERIVNSLDGEDALAKGAEMVDPEAVKLALETNAIEPYFQP